MPVPVLSVQVPKCHSCPVVLPESSPGLQGWHRATCSGGEGSCAVTVPEPSSSYMEGFCQSWCITLQSTALLCETNGLPLTQPKRFCEMHEQHKLLWKGAPLLAVPSLVLDILNLHIYIYAVYYFVFSLPQKMKRGKYFYSLK